MRPGDYLYELVYSNKLIKHLVHTVEEGVVKSSKGVSTNLKDVDTTYWSCSSLEKSVEWEVKERKINLEEAKVELEYREAELAQAKVALIRLQKLSDMTAEQVKASLVIYPNFESAHAAHELEEQKNATKDNS